MLKLLLWFYKRKNIKPKEKGLILNVLLESVNALPTKDIITFEANNLKINDKVLSPEQAVAIREGSVTLGKNWAYKVIKEQIVFEAITIGIHKGTSLDQILFSKAALWIQQREKELISRLAADSALFDTETE